MAVGKTAYLANKQLDHLRGGAAWSQPAGLFVKLHTADPGASGTGNAAANTTRVSAVFGTAAAGGVVANTTQVQWTGVSTAETYSHASMWDASTAGNCVWTAVLGSSVAVTVGATFTIAVGQLTLTETVAA